MKREVDCQEVRTGKTRDPVGISSRGRDLHASDAGLLLACHRDEVREVKKAFSLVSFLWSVVYRLLSRSEEKSFAFRIYRSGLVDGCIHDRLFVSIYVRSTRTLVV